MAPVLVGLSVAVNFRLGLLLEAAEGSRRRRLITTAVALNLLVLIVFKYAGFVVENGNALVGLVSTYRLPEPRISQPLGISFFTFHLILLSCRRLPWRGASPALPDRLHSTSSTSRSSSPARSSATARSRAFDFSGYSDMAIGLARLFGFHFPENFAYPYAATPMQDFWRRWHISLSLPSPVPPVSAGPPLGPSAENLPGKNLRIT